MPIIPRYQPRGGPAMRGLDYAWAYSAGDGSDWRRLGQAAALASDVSGAFNKGQAPARDRDRAVKAGLSEIDRVRAEIEALNWRRGQLDGDGQAVDAEQAELSRQAAGEGLSSGVRATFDAMTGPWVEGYAALADSRRDDHRSRAARTISQARQALGVEEFLKLADVAPSQARAALGSAAAAAGELARASGADEAGVAEARRATLVAAQVRRIGETIGRDPERAAKILEEEGGVLPDAQRARLSREIDLEQARVDANQAAAQMAGEHPDMVDDLDGFLAGMEAAAGDDAIRGAAYRGAALGAWRKARAVREASEDAAWAQVSPYLALDAEAAAWTDLPGPVWGALSEGQRATVRALLESPERESDPAVSAWVKALAGQDPEAFRTLDLGVLGSSLSAADHFHWRRLQLAARRNTDAWKKERAYLGRVGRAVQASMPAGVEDDARWALEARFQDVIADAEILKGGRLSWEEMIAACQQGVGTPQSNLTERDVEHNRRLWTQVISPDGLEFDPKTGQIFRRVAQPSPDDPSGVRFVKLLASDAEVARGRQRREQILRRSPALGQFSDRPGSAVVALHPPSPTPERLMSSIDWQFVAREEATGGIPALELYVPNEKGVVEGHSGVTLGLGFDLGGQSVGSLRDLEIPDYLIQMLKPYVGKQGSEALAVIKARPLTLSEGEVHFLTRKIHDRDLADLVQKFNAASTVGDFYSLPPGAQTALMSLFLNYGPRTPTRAEKTWTRMTTGDWAGAEKELRNFGDNNANRRRREADLLAAEIKAGRLKSVPTKPN